MKYICIFTCLSWHISREFKFKPKFLCNFYLNAISRWFLHKVSYVFSFCLTSTSFCHLYGIPEFPFCRIILVGREATDKSGSYYKYINDFCLASISSFIWYIYRYFSNVYIHLFKLYIFILYKPVVFVSSVLPICGIHFLHFLLLGSNME